MRVIRAAEVAALLWLDACLLLLAAVIATYVFFPAPRSALIDQPWIGYAERQIHSATLNVDAGDPLPTRRTVAATGSGQQRVVWLFGGSETFGEGLRDDQTIAAQLQSALQRELPGKAITVVNHGHANFFSSQELMLFGWLLREGKRADLAVFVDGPGDLRQPIDDPDSREEMPTDVSNPLIWFSEDFPLKRAWRAIVPHRPKPRDAAADARAIKARYERTRSMIQAIGNDHGIPTICLWKQAPPVKEIAAILAQGRRQ